MEKIGASLLLLVTFILAYGITRQVRSYAAMRLLDVPNDRSSHAEPTPRGGGLSIAVSFSLALLVCVALNWVTRDTAIGLIGGGLIVAGIGFWDDHGHVGARWRMLTHLLAATWAVYWLEAGNALMVNGAVVHIPDWMFAGVACLFIAWMLNLFNFMDGIDGIAGSETVFICLAAAGLTLLSGGTHQQVLPPLLLGVASLGFLIWNWPPAKIFMGDVGSGFVGFAVAALALLSAVTGALSLVVWLILSAVFIVDATYTLILRVLSGQRWYQAHRSHAFQHAADRLDSHHRVTTGVLWINALWLLPLALAANRLPDLELWLLMIAYTPLLAAAHRLDAGKENR